VRTYPNYREVGKIQQPLLPADIAQASLFPKSAGTTQIVWSLRVCKHKMCGPRPAGTASSAKKDEEKTVRENDELLNSSLRRSLAHCVTMVGEAPAPSGAARYSTQNRHKGFKRFAAYIAWVPRRPVVQLAGSSRPRFVWWTFLPPIAGGLLGVEGNTP
jgi:hypothetical protein